MAAVIVVFWLDLSLYSLGGVTHNSDGVEARFMPPGRKSFLLPLLQGPVGGMLAHRIQHLSFNSFGHFIPKDLSLMLRCSTKDKCSC